jgi:hypothetical protein
MDAAPAAAENDSIETLKADILADSEGQAAAQRAVDAKAEEFLVACVKFAKLWQLSGDPFLGIRNLAQAIQNINETSKLADKEIKARREPLAPRGQRGGVE